MGSLSSDGLFAVGVERPHANWNDEGRNDETRRKKGAQETVVNENEQTQHSIAVALHI